MGDKGRRVPLLHGGSVGIGVEDVLDLGGLASGESLDHEAEGVA